MPYSKDVGSESPGYMAGVLDIGTMLKALKTRSRWLPSQRRRAGFMTASAVGLWPSLMATATPAQEPTFRTSVTVVEMTVSVLGEDGTPRTDLSIADFEVVENGVVQTIDSVRLVAAGKNEARDADTLSQHTRSIATNRTQADLPLFILLLDDLQISPRYTAAAQRVGHRLLETLPQDALLAVVTTSGYESTLVTFDPPGETQRGLIKRFRGQALEGTSPDGGSGIGEVGPMRDPLDCRPYCVDPNRAARRMRVVEQLGQIVGRAGSRRKVMFWVTQSLGFTPVDLEEGRQAQRDALRALVNGDVTVYTVDPRELRANARSEWFSKDELEAAVTLTEFTRATGGQRFDNRNLVDGAVARAAQRNLSAYVLAYRPTAADRREPRDVSVRLPKHPDFILHARSRYFPVASGAEGNAEAGASPVADLLHSPVSGGNLPMAIQVVPVPTPEGAGVVMVSIEGPSDAPEGIPTEVALLTVDAAGEASEIASARLAVPMPPFRVSRLLALEPGHHQLRVACRLADGRAAGVIVTSVDVPIWSPKRLWLSDLMVADVLPDSTIGPLKLSANVVPGAPVAAQFEVAGSSLARKIHHGV